MNLNARSKIFWCVWLLVVIAVLWWMSSIMAHGAHYRTIHRELTQSPKGAEQFVPSRVVVKSPSSIIIPPRKPGTNVYFFAATAKSDDLESDYSNEVSYTNVLKSEFVTLGWDASPSTNVVGYRIYFGRSSGQYTNVTEAGTNLTCSVRILPPVLSNIVITITSRNATNLQWTPNLGQPWTFLGATNWTATNPAPRLWRATGKSPTQRGEVFVSGSRF